MSGTRSLDDTWTFPIDQQDFQIAVPPGREAFSLSPQAGDFSLVYLKEGSAILTVNEKRFAVHSPFLLTLEDGDVVAVEQSQRLSGTALRFHPQVINDRFDCPVLLRSPPENESTLLQDRFLLLPFFDRSPSWQGLLELPLPLQAVLTHHGTKLAAQLKEQPQWWPCRSRSYLLEILLLVNQLYQDQGGPGSALVSLPAEKDPLEEVLLFLHGHYHRDLRLEDLAARFATNRTTLNERFSSRFGTTVMAYLLNLRLRVASTLLRDTTLPSQEILERCGFTDQAHFSRMFKKSYLMNPSLYRKTHSWIAAKPV